MINAKHTFWLTTALAGLLILVACGGSQESQAPEALQARVVTVVETVIVEGESIEVTRLVSEVETEALVEGDGDVAATPAPIGTAVHQTAAQQRLIIKNGTMVITVEDTETAVNQATETAVQLGGYIISQQVWDDDRGYRFATMRVGVPVLHFEDALRAFRQLGTVTNEAASGEDVTDQYVDLQSRLDNLIATRDRLRAFLDQATTVEEALRINEELKTVEEEIAVIQGRLHYLADRAAFSTVDLTLNPWVPTPTPSPTPTNTPIPTAQAWHPGDTARLAAVDFQESAQDTADFGIYYGIVCGPWLVLFGLVGLAVWKVAAWWRRR